MEEPYKHITVDIHDVNLYPGMYLTVWLNRNSEGGERNAIQVELRVDSDGTPRLYSRLKEIKLIDFEQWVEGK